MGWGGYRPGAGRPPKDRPVRKVITPKRRDVIPPPQAADAGMARALAKADMALQQASARPHRLGTVNPKDMFRPYTPHPLAVPSGLAMDQDIVVSAQWAGNAIGSAYAEGLTFLGYPVLAEMAQRPEYRVIVETMAFETTRKWIKLKAKGEEDKTEQINQLNDELTRLGAQDAFRKSGELDGYFGRGHLFLDFGDLDDDELTQPIGDGWSPTSKLKVGIGSLRRLTSVEPVWTYPTTYNSNNPLKTNWYNPQVWYVMGKQIHASRLLTFISREVPDLLKPAYSFGGLPMTQIAKPYVDNWLNVRQGVTDIIQSFSTFVLSTDMQSMLSTGGGELMNRIGLFSAYRTNQGVMVIDKNNENFQNVSAPLGSLDALQRQAQEQMCSVARIPTVKLLGIQPSGMNASSEGEIATWDDNVAAYQEAVYRQNLRTVIGFAMLNIWGDVDPDIDFEFEPLRAMTDKEVAEQRKIEAETATIWIDSGVISPEEERRRVAGDPETMYPGLDPDDVPDLQEEEAAGLNPEGGPDPFKGGSGGGGESDVAEPAGDEDMGDDEASWNEGDHPRAKNGQFGSGGASGGGSSGSGGKSGGWKPSSWAAQAGEPHAKPATLGGGASSHKPWSSHASGAGGAPWSPPKPKPLPRKGWGDPASPEGVVIFTPTDPLPVKELNGVPFKPWHRPEEWADVEGQAEIDEPEMVVPDRKQAASGVLIREPDGRVWMTRPTNSFGGYQHTFPKGRAEEGLSMQANAIKEAWEETGLKARITGFAGDVEGDETMTRFYFAEREGGDPTDHSWESEGVVLAPPAELEKFLNRTRDRKIAKAHLAGDEAMFQETDHPRAPDGKFTSGGGGGGVSAGEGSKGASPSLPPKVEKAMGEAVAVSNKYGTGQSEAVWDLLSAENQKELLGYYGGMIQAKQAIISQLSKPATKYNAPHNPISGPAIDMSNMTKISGKKGSNPGGVYKDKDGNEFYIKESKSKNHTKNELLAAKLFALTGQPTLKYRSVLGGMNIATQMEKLQNDNVSKLSPAERKAAKEDFVTHAWLANYDAAGTGGDNIGVANGKVIPLDFGGSLLYRAQGLPKGDAFGKKVTELQTMVDPNKNPDGAKLYGDMTPEELKASAQRVANISEDEIQEAVESMGFEDVNDEIDLYEKLVARRLDIMNQFNVEFESKHARGAGGKFVSMGGAEETPQPKQPAAPEPAPTSFKSKKDHIAHLLSKGTTKAEVLAATGWPSVSFPAQAKAAGLKLTKVKEGGVTKYFGEPMNPKEKTEAMIDTVAAFQKKEQAATDPAAKAKAALATKAAMKRAVKLAAQVPGSPVAQMVEAEKAKLAQAAPAPAPASAYPPATPQELEKAKKSVKLQMQYVPGAPDTPEAHKLIADFNKKYEGKTITDPAELEKKVADFKKLKDDMIPLMSEQQKAAAEKQKQQAAAQAESQAKAKAAEAAEHAELMKDPSFSALAGVMGMSNAKDMIAHGKSVAKTMKGYNVDLTPVEGALIRSYIGSYYETMNVQAYEGALEPAQWKYRQALVAAMEKMPKYEGKVIRGIKNITAKDFAKYKAGHVVPSPALMSAGKVGKLWGSFTLEIKGKTARDISMLNSEGGGEVVFLPTTAFHVHSNNGKHAVLEEI